MSRSRRVAVDLMVVPERPADLPGDVAGAAPDQRQGIGQRLDDAAPRHMGNGGMGDHRSCSFSPESSCRAL
jgi:hypothetical protein